MEIKTREARKLAIALLAFISMVKNAHGNSVLYKEADYKLAKKIGMSDGRIFANYLTICLDKGLCVQHEQRFNTKGRRTVYKFIAYDDALCQLLGLKGGETKYFPLHKERINFKNYQYLIEEDLVALKIAQQEYQANSNFPNKNKIMKQINLLKNTVSGKTTGAKRSKRSKLLKKLNAADDQIKYSTLKGHVKEVVIGCNYISMIIGKSRSTGSKRINKYKASKKLQVEDIVRLTPVASELEAHFIIEMLQNQNPKAIHIYSKKEGRIKSILGKKVIGYTSTAYSYTARSNDNSMSTFSKSKKAKKMKENFKEGWSPNWGGRGLALVNGIEKMRVTKPKKLETEDKSYIKKLSELLRHNPENSFYKNLAKQLVQQKALTTKQVACVNADFHELIIKTSN